MIARGLAAVAFALTGALFSVTPAHAGGLSFVSASEGALEAAPTRLYGVSADSWVLFDPHQVYSLHLSSVYAWLDDGSYVEAGWAWYAGDGPQAYVAYERRGHTTDQQRIWLGPVRPGTWVHLEIVNASREERGPVRWVCTVGDRSAAVYQDFGRATLRISSERQTYRDSGYALFRSIEGLDATGAWSRWTDLRVQSGDEDYDGFRLPGGAFEVR